jgi:hypothetical protein
VEIPDDGRKSEMTDGILNVRRKFSIDEQTSETSNKHREVRGKFGINDQYCEMTDEKFAECTKIQLTAGTAGLLTKFTRGTLLSRNL